MKTIDELQKAVVAYAERHEYGMAKMTSRYPDELYYSYKNFKDDVLEGKNCYNEEREDKNSLQSKRGSYKYLQVKGFEDMTKEQMIKLADKYGFDFKDKNYKGEYTLHSRKLDGHVISSPTLDGLKRMLEKYGK